MTLPQTPSFRLDGKTALITGAGRGIGLAAAAALAQAGAKVTLVARSPGDIERAASAIREAGSEAETLTLDVLDITSASQFIERAGPFDVLVNNAGTNRPKPMLDVTTDDYDAIVNLNLRSAFFIAQAVSRGLIAAGRPGSLIHISSQMGHVGGVNRSVYCASKWGLEGMSKTFAIELAPQGIRSNTIAPTFTETPLIEPYLADKAFMQSILAKIKLGRLGKVEDLMGAVLFLATPASALVTGTSLVVDGGWTAD